MSLYTMYHEEAIQNILEIADQYQHHEHVLQGSLRHLGGIVSQSMSCFPERMHSDVRMTQVISNIFNLEAKDLVHGYKSAYPNIQRLAALLEVIVKIATKMHQTFEHVIESLEVTQKIIDESTADVLTQLGLISEDPTEKVTILNFHAVMTSNQVNLRTLLLPQRYLNDMAVKYMPLLKDLTKYVEFILTHFMLEWIRYLNQSIFNGLNTEIGEFRSGHNLIGCKQIGSSTIWRNEDMDTDELSISDDTPNTFKQQPIRKFSGFQNEIDSYSDSKGISDFFVESLNVLHLELEAVGQLLDHKVIRQCTVKIIRGKRNDTTYYPVTADAIEYKTTSSTNQKAIVFYNQKNGKRLKEVDLERADEIFHDRNAVEIYVDGTLLTLEFPSAFYEIWKHSLLKEKVSSSPERLEMRKRLDVHRDYAVRREVQRGEIPLSVPQPPVPSTSKMERKTNEYNEWKLKMQRNVPNDLQKRTAMRTAHFRNIQNLESLRTQQRPQVARNSKRADTVQHQRCPDCERMRNTRRSNSIFDPSHCAIQ